MPEEITSHPQSSNNPYSLKYIKDLVGVIEAISAQTAANVNKAEQSEHQALQFILNKTFEIGTAAFIISEKVENVDIVSGTPKVVTAALSTEIKGYLILDSSNNKDLTNSFSTTISSNTITIESNVDKTGLVVIIQQ